MKDSYRVLKGGTLIDGNGGVPVENSIVIIKNDRIKVAKKASSVSIPKGADVVDVSGKTVMPGLIDAHVHLLGIKTSNPKDCLINPPELRAMRAVMDCWRILDCGFTTVRDCGNYPNGVLLKSAVEEGSIVGPRILSCGGFILSTTWAHIDVLRSIPIEWFKERNAYFIVADGVDECRKKVRENLRAGADCIKTYDMYSLEEIKAIVEEARENGIKTAIHAYMPETIKKVIKAEPDTIEHGPYMDDEDIEKMIKQGIVLIPTFAYLEASLTKGAKDGADEKTLTRFRETQAQHFESFDRAWRAGVKIGIGSDYMGDAISPMGKNAAEMAIHVRIGRTPMDVIVSATKINSEALGIDDKLGTLEAGKLADVIVVNEDPLKDIKVLCDKSNIVKVYKGGKEVPRLNQAV